MSTFFWSSTSSTDPTLGANWTRSDGTTGAAPASGDDVYIQPIAGVVLANIGSADMSAVVLNSLSISQGFMGTIGTAATTGSFGYWKIGTASWTIGAPAADGVAYSGSGRIKIDFGTTMFSGTVLASGTSADSGAEPVRLLANNTASRIVVLGGRVGIATNLPGETATIAQVDVAGSGAVCNLGPGVAWTNATVAAGGMLTTRSGSSGALSVASGGGAATYGSAAIAMLNAGGNVQLNHRPPSAASITTLNLLPTGTADFSQNPLAVTVTTLNHHRGGVLSANSANPGHLTITTRTLVNCGTLTAS